MDRIAGKYTINPVTQCWTWARGCSSQGRYPSISTEASGRVPVLVHKAMWVSVNGPVPAGPCPDGSDRYELHHSCAPVNSTNDGLNRCVNPAHIQCLTRKEHAAEHKEMRLALKAAKQGKVIAFPSNPNPNIPIDVIIAALFGIPIDLVKGGMDQVAA
jgi:hypothetical protein